MGNMLSGLVSKTRGRGRKGKGKSARGGEKDFSGAYEQFFFLIF